MSNNKEYMVWDKQLKRWVVDKDLKKKFDIRQCKNHYEPALENLKSSYVGALADDIKNNELPISEEYCKLLVEYAAAMKKITDGATVSFPQIDRIFCPLCGTKLINKKCPHCHWEP